MVNPRTYVSNDKKIPASMSGDAGKTLTVNATETAYEHAGSISGTQTGTIIMWPTNQAPSGYLNCDGTEYDTSVYPALSALLGESSAGKFVVPNIDFPKGSGGINTLVKEPATVGSHTHTTDIEPHHIHNVTIASVPNHEHTVRSRALKSLNTSTGAAVSVYEVSGYEFTSDQGAHSHTNTVSGDGAHEHQVYANPGAGPNQPACTLINFCIKV